MAFAQAHIVFYQSFEKKRNHKAGWNYLQDTGSALYVNGQAQPGEKKEFMDFFPHVRGLFEAASVGCRTIWIGSSKLPEKLTQGFVNRWSAEGRYGRNNTRVYVPANQNDNLMVTVVGDCQPVRSDEHDFTLYADDKRVPDTIMNVDRDSYLLKAFVYAASLVPEDRNTHIELWYGIGKNLAPSQALKGLPEQGIRKFDLSSMDDQKRSHINQHLSEKLRCAPDLSI